MNPEPFYRIEAWPLGWLIFGQVEADGRASLRGRDMKEIHRLFPRHAILDFKLTEHFVKARPGTVFCVASVENAAKWRKEVGIDL